MQQFHGSFSSASFEAWRTLAFSFLIASGSNYPGGSIAVTASIWVI